MMLLILVLVVVWIFYYTSIEPFAPTPVSEESNTLKTFFNAINNNINPSDHPAVSGNKIAAATQGVQTENQIFLANAYEKDVEAGDVAQVGEVYKTMPDLTIAQTVCEPITESDCSAFDNPDFKAYCGISFDSKGTNSKGETRIGGLYINPSEKASKPSNGIYAPTYGSSSQFAINKASCKFMKEDIACKKLANDIGTENCSTCFSDGSRHAVEPTTTKVNPDFVFYTNADGGLAMIMDGSWQSYIIIPGPNDKTSPGVTKGASISVDGIEYKQVILPSVPIKEGQQFYLVSSSSKPFGVAGYIQAATQTGTYKIDLNAVLDGQLNERSRPNRWSDPNIGGDIDNYMLFMAFDEDKRLLLKGMMPFTFMGPATPDAVNCSNGPFITTQKAKRYMAENEPCYDSETGPGTYKLACLQQLFLASGGTRAGKGYPVDEQTSQPLLYDTKGNARTLGQIGQFLYRQSLLASTGLQDGQSVNIVVWDRASVFMTNTPIANECQTRKPGQPLSNECLQYLYKNSGCGTKGTYNPDPVKGHPVPQGIAAAKKAGNQDAAAQFYANALNTVNTPSLPNSQRAPAFLGCYGIELLQK